MLTPRQQSKLARLREFRNGTACTYYTVNGQKRYSLQFGTEMAGRGDKGQRYTDSVETYGELVWNSETDARGNDAEGYYADNFQYDCVRFGVVRVRHSRGCDYVPVTWQDDCDGATYHFRDAERVGKGRDGESEHEQAIKDASYHADSIAEFQAEDEREYHARDQAEQQIEHAKEQIEEHIRHFCHLFRSRKFIVLNSPAWQDTRRWMSEQREGIRASRKRIETLTQDFWQAVN